MSSNGPIPLCVRHEDHEQKPGPTSLVIECAQCAEELARILEEENIIKTTTRKDRPQTCPAAAASAVEGAKTML